MNPTITRKAPMVTRVGHTYCQRFKKKKSSGIFGWYSVAQFGHHCWLSFMSLKLSHQHLFNGVCTWSFNVHLKSFFSISSLISSHRNLYSPFNIFFEMSAFLLVITLNVVFSNLDMYQLFYFIKKIKLFC